MSMYCSNAHMIDKKAANDCLSCAVEFCDWCLEADTDPEPDENLNPIVDGATGKAARICDGCYNMGTET